jgi:hypothetical protein
MYRKLVEEEKLESILLFQEALVRQARDWSLVEYFVTAKKCSKKKDLIVFI